MEISDLVPIAGIVASIIGAGFVARHQIKKLEIDADNRQRNARPAYVDLVINIIAFRNGTANARNRSNSERHRVD